MDGWGGLELANGNAASHWLAMAAAEGWESRTGAGYAAARCARDESDGHRVVLTRRPADAAGLTRELVELFREWGSAVVCVEDPYGVLDLSGHTCESALPMPVMVRPVGAGAVREREGASGVEVVEAVTPDELDLLEQVVVEGFPVPGRSPWRSGGMFPPSWSRVQGRRGWLARRDGVPAGGCVSWDDGHAVGLYWVAVLPEHRSCGVGRQLVERVLRVHPRRDAVLTATLLGEPLYRRLGFVTQGEATWWRYPGLPAPGGPATGDATPGAAAARGGGA